MAEVKKAWKLTESVAHAPGSITALALGQKSGRVMASGGSDGKINLWAVGKPACIMSLVGYQSTVEVVRFAEDEHRISAGGFNGGLKLWDLEQAKLIRTLTGHKAALRSLDFHLYGDYIASGCTDSTIKLWDIRRKGCIFTYKGHTDCVNALRFSPDGKWLVSASSDSTIRLWDLGAGRQLAQFDRHSGPVTGIAFHPNYLLLGSCSADKTIRFWDLETFEVTCESRDGDCPGPVRSLVFHPEGKCAYAATGDLLKVFSVEPTQPLEAIVVGWNKHELGDMVYMTSANQLIGGAYSAGMLHTFVMDVKNCAPFVSTVKPQGFVPPQSIALADNPSPSKPSQHKSYPINDKGASSQPPPAAVHPSKAQHLSAAAAAADASADSYDVDASAAGTDITDVEEYRRIFKPRQRKLNHSPSREEVGFQPPSDHVSGSETFRVQQNAAAVPISRARLPSEIEGLRLNDFQLKDPTGNVDQDGADVDRQSTELEVMTRIREPHTVVLDILETRRKNIQTVRALWGNNSVRTAVDSSLAMRDEQVLVDLLSHVLTQKEQLWTLDIASSVVPHLGRLLTSKHVRYTEVSCLALRLLLRLFSKLIRDTLNAPSSIGIDVQQEERKRKCKFISDELRKVNVILSNPSVLSNAGALGREVLLLVGQFVEK